MLWVVSPKVFRLLRDRAFNAETVYSTPPYPPLSHCLLAKPIELPQPPSHPTTTILTFDVWDFEFAVFPFPKVFRQLRDESPSSWYLHQEHRHSSSQRTVTSTTPLYIPLAIALITPSPLYVTCLTRLAIWVLPATLLVHISDHTSHSIHTISYWYHILCHKFVPAYTQLLSWFVHCAKVAIYKKRINLLSKRERAKKLVRKFHSIIPHCI